jgi:hypothetical protein
MDETPGPGAVETEIAHRYGIATNLVLTWRRRPRLARFGRKRPSIDSPTAMPARKRSGGRTGVMYRLDYATFTRGYP